MPLLVPNLLTHYRTVGGKDSNIPIYSFTVSFNKCLLGVNTALGTGNNSVKKDKD
jgi:hypothetical protein